MIPDHAVRMRAAPERKRQLLPLEVDVAEGTISGYASLFGQVDLGKDMVCRGAFRRSLADRPASGVRMLYQHDPLQPVGVWTSLKEDARGLFARGMLDTGCAKGRDVLALLRSGSVDGLSIGFRTERSRTDRKTGIRSILEADLWEISIVTFPMLPAARVTQVKAAHGATQGSELLPSRRTLERWLTQDAGLSRSKARALIAKGLQSPAGKQDAARQDMATRLRAAANLFKTS